MSNITSEWTLNRAQMPEQLQSDIFKISVRKFQRFFPYISIFVPYGYKNEASAEKVSA